MNKKKIGETQLSRISFRSWICWGFMELTGKLAIMCAERVGKKENFDEIKVLGVL